MSPFRSTLVSHVDLCTPEVHVRTFALDRNGGSASGAAPLPAPWCRSILHLSGSGIDPAGGSEAPGASGTLEVLPPGEPSRMRLPPERPSLSVVLEFRLKRVQPVAPVSCVIQPGELAWVRQQVAYLLRVRPEAAGVNGWESAPIILQILAMLLRSAGWLAPSPVAVSAPTPSAMHRLLLTMPLEAPLSGVVRQSGYQRDHLNRLVKKETGLTLGQFRAQRRLLKAKELLGSGVKVGDVAGAVGLPDQSYFARWFRRQTGESPLEWVQRGSGSGQPDADLVLRCG